MRFLGMAAAVASSLFALQAYAGEVTLCAGAPGGGYDGLMRAVGTELTKQGHTTTILNLSGSENILNALDGKQCAYGPAQGDVFYLMTKNSQGLQASVTPVDILYNEVMTLVCSSASGIDELEDLQAGDTVIVDSIGSGSALTWENIRNIEKEFGNGSSWASAQPVYQPLDEAGGALALGQAKCAFGVGKVPSNWALSLQERGHTVSYIYDKDINDLEFPVGQSLYEGIRIQAASGAYRSKFDTYKVPAILFRSAETKVDPGIEKLIKRVAPSLGNRQNTVK